MDYPALQKRITQQLPDIDVHLHHSLAPYTTLKIGGPANLFVHPTSSQQFISLIKLLHQSTSNLPFIIGHGSNLLISDSGIPGIVIKNSSQKIFIQKPLKNPIDTSPRISPHRSLHHRSLYLDFETLNYDESDSPQITVKISSGTPLYYALDYLLDHHITGFQWFAGIPASIGGAIYSNTHGGHYHISDLLDSIKIFNYKTGKVQTLSKKDLSWAYDQSPFQKNPHLIILSATFILYRGNSTKAKQVATKWAQQKSKVQPRNSAGSVFKNPPLPACKKIWGHQKSAGWIIDQLNLKNKAVGGAKVSPKHANFIVNTGSATATDYLKLIRFIQKKVKQKFGLKLQLEIKLFGHH